MNNPFFNYAFSCFLYYTLYRQGTGIEVFPRQRNNGNESKIAQSIQVADLTLASILILILIFSSFLSIVLYCPSTLYRQGTGIDVSPRQRNHGNEKKIAQSIQEADLTLASHFDFDFDFFFFFKYCLVQSQLDITRADENSMENWRCRMVLYNKEKIDRCPYGGIEIRTVVNEQMK